MKELLIKLFSGDFCKFSFKDKQGIEHIKLYVGSMISDDKFNQINTYNGSKVVCQDNVERTLKCTPKGTPYTNKYGLPKTTPEHKVELSPDTREFIADISTLLG